MPALEAPPAPAAPAAAPKAPAAALPNAPKVELRPQDLGVPRNAPQPKPGSAKSKMIDALRAKADPNYKPAEPPAPKEEKKADVPDKPDETEEDPAAPPPDKKEVADPGEDDAPPADPAVAPAAKKDKPNPWKLMEEHKAARAAAEAKLLETEKRAIPEEKWKEKEAALEKSNKRLAELEQEIRHVKYEKSDEFVEKYQKPYFAAWDRAMSELGEIVVQDTNLEGDPVGDPRQLTTKDILELVEMPIGKAAEVARQKFGDLLAPEVMAHRMAIKKLNNDQVAALENEKKNGAEREKMESAKSQKAREEIEGIIKTNFVKANEELSVDPKHSAYFKPRDGDEQGNQRLAKGYEMANRAFSENPTADGLTAEQRASIVRRHVAVRNRAAAYGRLVYDLGQRDVKIAEMQKIIDEYKGSEPNRDGSKKATQPVQRSAKTSMFEELRKLAKPGL